MSNGLMGPPLPKRVAMNKSLAPPDDEEQFVLTPQKIETVLSKYTPLKLDSSPQRAVVIKAAPMNLVAEDENHRPPWNGDFHVPKNKHSPATPFTRSVFGEVNQLRGARVPKSFERRLKESQENKAEVSELNVLSQYMSQLSTDAKGKDEKIKMLEGDLAQAKKELNQLKMTANARQVEWVETLRNETEVRQRMEVELSQLKAKMEIEKQGLIQESAQIDYLERELSLAISLMDNQQKEKFKSRIPRR